MAQRPSASSGACSAAPHGSTRRRLSGAISYSGEASGSRKSLIFGFRGGPEPENQRFPASRTLQIGSGALENLLYYIYIYTAGIARLTLIPP